MPLTAIHIKSSSAILVASVTETNLFDNIRNMLRTAAVPFVLTCLIYGAIGLGGANQVDATSVSDVFAKEFQLNRWMILPAIIVLGLSMLRDAKSNHVQLMGAMDAGIVSQNISLFCSAARLATVPRASMDLVRLKAALKLKDTQMPMMNHPVGYFK